MKRSHATRQVDDSSQETPKNIVIVNVGSQGPRKNLNSHIDASHSRQPLVKGERLVRYEVNAVMPMGRGGARRPIQQHLNLPLAEMRENEKASSNVIVAWQRGPKARALKREREREREREGRRPAGWPKASWFGKGNGVLLP